MVISVKLANKGLQVARNAMIKDNAPNATKERGNSMITSNALSVIMAGI